MYDFSVIIPVYNGEKFLSECLDSICQQTFKNIQIIVVNDGSTDSSKEIIEYYKSINSNIIFIDKENEGAGIARNIGLMRATGDYITFIDCDDTVHPLMFETIKKYLEKEDIDILQFGMTRKMEQLLVNKGSEGIILSKEEALDKFCKLKISGYSCGKVFKRNLIQENQIVFGDTFCFEDMQFILLAIQKCKNYKIIEEKMYFYRENNSSLTNAITPKHFKVYMCEREKWISFLLENNTSQSYNQLENFRVLTYINCLTWFIKSDYFSYKKYKQLMKSQFNLKNNQLYLRRIFMLRNLNKGYKLVYFLIYLGIYPLYIRSQIDKDIY